VIFALQTYIEPDLKTAHLRIHNHFNPFSGLMNPIYILKSAKPVTKQQIKAVLKVCPSVTTAVASVFSSSSLMLSTCRTQAPQDVSCA
jgi:hypothetical protein